MSLLVLFRSRLEWCNFACGYCPWNATLSTASAETFREDRRRVERVVDRVAELPRPVEFFVTPKAEYMVLPYWREAVRRLLALPQVTRVTVQTNLSFDVGPFLDSCRADKLALWATYHPGEVGDRREELFARYDLLVSRGVPFSVGVVGTREHLPALRTLRDRLDPRVYVWVNAYKRQPDYYSPAEREAIRAVDPLFDLNASDYASRGRPCTAGQRAVTLDDEGDLRRCFFVGGVLGNLFRDGWVTLDGPHACPAHSCHCYVGRMHAADLDYRGAYGEFLAARIPLAYHGAVTPPTPAAGAPPPARPACPAPTPGGR